MLCSFPGGGQQGSPVPFTGTSFQEDAGPREGPRALWAHAQHPFPGGPPRGLRTMVLMGAPAAVVTSVSQEDGGLPAGTLARE